MIDVSVGFFSCRKGRGFRICDKTIRPHNAVLTNVAKLSQKPFFFYLQHNPITTVSVNETIMRSLTQETDGKRYCCPGPWPLHSMKLLEKPHTCTALLFNCHCLIQFRAHRGIWKKKNHKNQIEPCWTAAE